MRVAIECGLFLSALLSIASPLNARQGPPGPAQPLNMNIPKVNGTGAISGVVTDGTTKKPVAGVVVYLGPPNRGPIDQPTQQISDARGRFVFRDLPASDAYFINATKPGYFDGHAGRTTSTQVGARISIADGQWVGDVSIVMNRGAAVSGTVTDELGGPIVGAYVRAIPEVLVSGRPHLIAGPVATTDDRGMYRISGLPAGKYLVQVPIVQESLPGTLPPAQLAGTPAQPLAALPQRDDPDVLLIGGRYPANPTGGTQQTAYRPTFYPSAPTPAGALSVFLGYGEERSGIDLHLEPVPTSRVTGIVQGPTDALTNLTLRLLAPGMEDLGDGSETATALVAPDGRFTLLNVPAGTYTIDGRRSVAQFEFSNLATPTKALPRPPGLPPSGGGLSTSLVAAAPQGTRIATRSSGEPTYAARATVTVEARDLTNVVVTLQRSVSLTGRIVREGPGPGTGPTFVPVLAEPANGSPSLGSARSRMDSRDPEFRIDGLLPGEYYLRFLGGLGVKSIRWDGRDMTSIPFDASSGRDFTDVEVTVSTEGVVVAGTVRIESGEVSKTAAVMVFPEERSQWSNYGYTPPRIKTATVNSAGLYRFQSLPAGNYYIVAVDDALIDGWQDPAFLERAARAGTRFSVAWGDRLTQDLVLKDVK